MAFVLDCSVAMSWVFPDEADAITEALRERLMFESAVVPAIWPMEIGNCLIVAVRRGRIRRDELGGLQQLLLDLPVEIDPLHLNTVLGRCLDLSDQHTLSVYDAMYLELSIRRGLPLATLDKRLSKACSNAGVKLVA
ncbi:MAG: type II toxin-antitoxin system VapC family toxin [Gammaproteobacteria bacterium]|nr:type II toxin-antitoxin system VapC family toxin [Gammaproteobacteria bacterium]